MAHHHLQRALPIADIGCGDMNRMRQAVRIDRQMPLDPGHLLPRVIPFFLCRVRILHALRIDDAKRRFLSPAVSLAFLRHLIF